MASIVFDLQNDIYSNEKDLSEILRKAHVIARKLNLSEFDEWINKELNGYDINNIPEYRKIRGELKAVNPFRGWIPVLIENSEMEDMICIKGIPNSIPNLEEMLKMPNGNITYNMTSEQNLFIASRTGRKTTYAVFFSKTTISSIITYVKNYILDWTLKLEEKNILGEDMRFTQEEKTKAEAVTHVVNYFYGNTNYNGGEIGNQNVTINNNTVDYDLANKKLSEIENEVNSYGLDELSVADLKELIKEAKEKIKQKKSPGIVKTALKAIREFAISTASNIAAAAITAKLNGVI